MEIGFQVPSFCGLHWFSGVATVEKPVETEMLKYWCGQGIIFII